ncbi:GH25 family lysozyme [Streptomyces sp. I05A-00742]|uniref:GH25 family lysozyme n=1 Tax=Streptomyces sp. I05A-00742 TaxID=2732853 RepID=UPI0014892662|nr:GH25 family lysozyme [Streptomyces sp. I05A-00742]
MKPLIRTLVPARRRNGPAAVVAAVAAVAVFAFLVQPAAARAEGNHYTGHRIVPLPRERAAVRGLDVSSYQGAVDWPAVAAAGAAFAYVKATEGLTYRNEFFQQQYEGSADAGLVRGAYHFARPDSSGGAAQADAFLDGGGGWTADGRTLPGALDIEGVAASDAPACYGLDQEGMVDWIRAFAERYRQRTGRHPVLYTNVTWWSQCTGGSRAFATTLPLWVANHNGTAHPLPSGWTTYAVWQTADHGPFPGDQDVFNGSLRDLRAFAEGS